METQMRSGDQLGCVMRAMRDAVRVHVPVGAGGEVALKWMALAAIAAVNVHNRKAGLELVCEPHLWNTRVHVAHAVENPAIVDSMWLAQLKWQIHMLSPDPTKVMIYPADSMPSFLDHGKGTTPHAKDLNGNLSHNGAIHETAQQLSDIIAR